ncbi:hypothetical protein [Streptomyces celluloflavus]|uniref:hypothetical protein n=1 Tax=Streptomyces celluloflavus TaxID=58344 RepID=UPI0034604217|nr:hypothetical protein OG717_12335 [Streptomyces celluloflavus]
MRDLAGAVHDGDEADLQFAADVGGQFGAGVERGVQQELLVELLLGQGVAVAVVADVLGEVSGADARKGQQSGGEREAGHGHEASSGELEVRGRPR